LRELFHPNIDQLCLSTILNALGDPIRLQVIKNLSELQHQSAEVRALPSFQGIAGIGPDQGEDRGQAAVSIDTVRRTGGTVPRLVELHNKEHMIFAYPCVLIG